MRIIDAVDQHGNELSQAQIECDRERLIKAHKKALQEDPTWAMFGGNIFIDGRQYQVCQ